MYEQLFLLAIIKNALGGTVQYYSAGERAVRVGWGSNCSSQPSMVHWLSSSIFPLLFVVPLW